MGQNVSGLLQPKCLVCGSFDMAKAHLFPRAIMHEIRGEDTRIYAADAIREKWDIHQSGEWDSEILCKP